MSEDSRANGGNNDMARKPRTTPPSRLSVKAADDNSAGLLPRQSDGADGARSKGPAAGGGDTRDAASAAANN